MSSLASCVVDLSPPVILAALLAACSFDGKGVAFDDPPPDAATMADARGNVDGPGNDAPDDVDGAPEIDAAPAGQCDDPELVLCMEFEGNTSDSSMAMNHALSKGVGYTDSGRHNRAIAVGPQNVIFVPDDSSLDVGAITIDAWVFPQQSGGPMTILDNDEQYLVRLRSDRELHCLVGMVPNDLYGVSGGLVPLDTWSHIACTYDPSGELTVYINGTPVATESTPSGPILDQNNGGIAIASSYGSSPFIGRLDTLRIWPRPLTAGEIAALASQ